MTSLEGYQNAVMMSREIPNNKDPFFSLVHSLLPAALKREERPFALVKKFLCPINLESF
jgi:hypothetical protein